MAMTSAMLPIGTTAPPFDLLDVVTGQRYSLDSFATRTGLLVMFICRHCPYVVHVEHELAKLGHDYQETNLGIIAISSNDPINYPDDAPPRLKEMAVRLGFKFPFCHDETQEVAKAYRAACTPEFYFLIKIVIWPTMDSSMTAAPVTTSRSQVAISVQPFKPCSVVSLSMAIRDPA